MTINGEWAGGIFKGDGKMDFKDTTSCKGNFIEGQLAGENSEY